ncbi:MAG: NfeD family protein [Bacteroidales bacterium]|nr:NfeD family protein [Bacteroidales bacterium]
MKQLLRLLFVLLWWSFSFHSLFATPVIYKVDIKKEIGPTTSIYLRNALNEAKTHNAEQVLIHLNTYGGALVDADSMRTAILYSPIPVSVFIDNDAASAGALISVACNKIYMREGACIGAATVVDEKGSPLPDKYQSYMRAMMRSTCEAHGKDSTGKWYRDPVVAEAMVLDSISGKVLTLTANEAVKAGYCDGKAETVDEVITDCMGYPEYELKTYTPSFFDEVKGFLSNPYLQAVLIMIIIGGIYFELQSPGIGFPIIAAITAGILYFAPLYIDGLALYWEIIIFVIGVLLLLLEIFVIPGFGIAGILGIIFLVGGLTLSLLNNVGFDFTFTSSRDILLALLVVSSGFVGSVVLMIYLSNKIGTKGMFRRLALNADQEGFQATSDEPERVVGTVGVAATDLRPSGKVEIDGRQYDAVSERDFIEKGRQVKVVKYRIGQLYVERI